MAYKTTQLLAAAMLLSMAVAAMAGRQDAPQAELEAKKKYGHKDDYHKDEYHAKEEYHPKEYYPPAGEYYPPTGDHYPKPHEYQPAYPPHYGPAPYAHDYPKTPNPPLPAKCKCDDVNADLTLCDGECVNTDTNEKYCGGCKNSACVDTQVCDKGTCKCEAPNSKLCNGKCVNPMSFDMDNDNCGKCGVACDPTSAKPVCIMGTCMACKGVDEKFCPKVDKCVNTKTDEDNCGDCDKRCATGDFCEAGKCCKGEGASCVNASDKSCCGDLECKNSGMGMNFSCQKK